MAKMGRPRLPVEDCRSERLVTFVTQRDRAVINKMAQDSNASVSAMCERLIRIGLETVRVPDEENPTL